MKKLFLAVVVIFAVTAVYLINNPARLLTALNMLASINQGITRTKVTVGDEKWIYNISGKGETLILLHGFGGSKEVWNPIMPYLAEHFTVIAVDIPGFGDSVKDPNKSYTVANQTARLRQFVKHLGLTNIHLAGNSMGGAIAGDYAAKYPRSVKNLWLIAPSGVDAAEPSDYEQNLDETGDDIMIPRTQADFENMMTWLYHTPPPLPMLLKRGLIAAANDSADFFENVHEDLMFDWIPLEDVIEGLEVPVLITWGRNDRLVHVSGAQVLADILPEVEINLLPNCGHIPMLEYPQQTAQAFIAFAQAQAAEEAE